ncbi:MAG: right-handed parallel beta-helix repeat-containing protein [Ardenticatenaceae bacterium]|nr:right-handed parallel beta-helix repeat-containing protein [Ardenticatenaceae bacterium]
MKKRIRIVTVILGMTLAVWLLSQRAYAQDGLSQPSVNAAAPAATYTVNSNDDTDDGSCNSTHCSLREAINAANSHAGSDTILFDFTGPVAILPTSALPIITDPVIIDAIAFSSGHCPTLTGPADIEVTLSGFAAGNVSGLRLGEGSSGSTIKGLAIILFQQFGVVVEPGSDNNIIRCNHIGIDASGNIGLGNGASGITINGDNNRVGGSSPDDRNVISDNGTAGVLLNSEGAFNVVAGNYIGTEADGVSPQGNSLRGVGIYGSNNTIGGLTTSERNVIADNVADGIWVSDQGGVPTDNLIINNYIGVDKNGDPLGNHNNGVWLREGTGTTVGNSSAPNLIAHNSWNGIRVGEDAEENALRVNIIRDNGLLGIDLQGPGEALGEVTLNDTNSDNDTGANGLQNYPILNSAEVNGRIQGTLAGAPGNDISLFFYTNSRCDDSGYGEGAQFRQAVDVTIPGGGVLVFDFFLSSPLNAGQYIVATAIDISNENTSEFSNCAQVSEATFVVDSIGTVADGNPGDGLCDVPGVPTECTLRAAIMEINGLASNGPFRIEFNIPGAGPHVIAPLNAFDAITKPVTIDGTSQPGAACPDGSTPANLLIVLDGSGMTGVFSGSGLTLAAGSDGSEISGLVIGGFSEQGLVVNSDNNAITCNHIGVNAAGTADFGNALNGIRVSGASNRIGGLSSSVRNVISGNDVSGILLSSGATENKVQGNYIGLNAAGDAALGNTEAGIRLNEATGNRIGGSVGTARNVVSGNGLYGIQLRSLSDGNQVWGNRIGTDRTGTTAVPNQTGIYVRNANSNEVGGDAAEKGNLIAGNSLNGVRIHDAAANNLVQYNTIGLNLNGDALGNGSHGLFLDANVALTLVVDNTIAHNNAAGVAIVASSTQNTVYANSIWANGGLGIDLNDDGVTAHDGVNDADTGANNLQNAPLMRSANPTTGDISGTMEGVPNTVYRLDFYANDTCDPAGYGEGQVYLGNGSVTTGATGSQQFTVAVGGYAAGDFITTTATDPSGNTSEFSICATAGGSPPVYLPLVVK